MKLGNDTYDSVVRVPWLEKEQSEGVSTVFILVETGISYNFL